MAEIKIVRILGVDDDIICKITRAGGKWQIHNPLIIRCIPVEDENGQFLIDKNNPNNKVSFNVVMAPFHMPYMRSDRPLECSTCQVSYQIDPTDDVIGKYNSVFSSIIQPKFSSAIKK